MIDCIDQDRKNVNGAGKLMMVTVVTVHIIHTTAAASLQHTVVYLVSTNIYNTHYNITNRNVTSHHSNIVLLIHTKQEIVVLII